MVFADSNKYWNDLPAGAKAVKSKAGTTIPIALVTSADAEVGIEGISYESLKGDLRKSIRDLKETLKTMAVAGGPDSGSEEKIGEASDGKKLLAEEQTWTNAAGKEIKAAIRKVEGAQVEFLMPDGRALHYPLENLSGESREKIAGLVKSPAPAL